MNKEQLKADIISAMDEYTSTPEAWEDAVLTVDTATGKVELMEEEDAEALPDDSIDIWNPMDLVQMTSDGKWIADRDSIDSMISEYA